MIDRFTRQNLLDLVQKQNDPCVTIYVAAEKTGTEIYKPVPRLKKLVKSAKQKLASHWMSDTDAIKFLSPIDELTGDHDFWQQTEPGLALFLNADSLQYWRVAQPFAEQLFVSRYFFVQPIVATIGIDDPFYVLSLSQNKAELYDADLTRIEKLDVPGKPDGIEDAMNVTSVDRGSQIHTGSRTVGGKQASVFHGHGGKPDTSKDEARQYYRQVSAAVASYLKGRQQPMVLACVAEHVPIYRDVNTYPHLLDDVAIGSPDHLTEAQLLVKARPILEKHSSDTRQSTVKAFREVANTSRSLTEKTALLVAAHQGQIDKLFVSETASIPGEFDVLNQTVNYDSSTNDCNLDLVEDAIAQTLLHGGDVISLTENEIPGNEPMVATLRY